MTAKEKGRKNYYFPFTKKPVQIFLFGLCVRIFYGGKSNFFFVGKMNVFVKAHTQTQST